MPRVFRFAIDRGGTFTDVYAEMDVLGADGSVARVEPCVIKLLSEDPANYPDAPRWGAYCLLCPLDDAVDGLMVSMSFQRGHSARAGTHDGRAAPARPLGGHVPHPVHPNGWVERLVVDRSA